MRFCHLALFLLLVQVSSLVSEDQQQCEPGFSEQRYAFTVNRKVLERGRIIGKVSFTSCSTNNRALYSPDDTRFRVFPDGKVTLKRQITLHDGSLSFVLNAWDAKGMRHSVPIFVWNEREQQKAHGKGKQPLLVFPEKPSGLKRRKRHWVIPPIRVPENLKGPFPKRFAQIKSTMEANMNILYSITGQGVDSPPEGVFSVEKETGRMMVNKPLDREEYALYTVLCHAVSLNGRPAEGPLQIIIQVLDQNDNRPKFTEEVFRGSVREGVTPGTPVMTITATDDDDPKTANAILGYSILKQEPEDPAAGLFTINSVSGVISVIGTGLDRERVPEYVLTVQVADMEGNGLSTTAKAVIQILDTNDNAPVFDPVKESMSGGSLLSTHVLNTAQGIPAKGLTITLSKMDANQTKWVQVSRSVTNEDGRCPGLLRGEPLTAGTFQLRFDTKDYWKQMQQDSFYPYVEVVFTITDPQQKHHVPLLLSPFSYTTYRGS